MSCPRSRSRKRMLEDERLELRHEVAAAAELELGVDQILPRCQAQLLQPPRLADADLVVGEVGERRAAPECERRAQLGRALLRRGGLTCLLYEPLEAQEVEPVRVDVQDVTGLSPLDRVAAELRPQLRDVVVQRLSRGPRRTPGPELIDQHIGRDDLARSHGEQADERPVLSPGQRDHAVADARLDRAENGNGQVHVTNCPARFA